MFRVSDEMSDKDTQLWEYFIYANLLSRMLIMSQNEAMQLQQPGLLAWLRSSFLPRETTCIQLLTQKNLNKNTVFCAINTFKLARRGIGAWVVIDSRKRRSSGGTGGKRAIRRQEVKWKTGRMNEWLHFICSSTSSRSLPLSIHHTGATQRAQGKWAWQEQGTNMEHTCLCTLLAQSIRIDHQSSTTEKSYIKRS